MFFKPKQKKNTITYSLEIYNTQEGEPRSSVMESSDYDFAMDKYSKKDFRGKFVKEYMNYIELNKGVKVFNCKFERPKFDSNFLNFYIYLWKDDSDIQYRIEDSNSFYIKSFYKILDKHNLPGITRETKIQFFQKNIQNIMYGKVLNLTWRDIHCSIKEDFSEIADLSCWSNFYVFIKEERFSEVIENIQYLESIKKYCYEKAKKHDVNGILNYKEFHIRIDNYNNYQSIGGRNYFNSDLMFNCLLF